ncbi:MAG: hypothetical protein LBR15_09835 [Methanobrevibacter sp.]|nr:hypothetical protein [Candidatus Methanovirga australis]
MNDRNNSDYIDFEAFFYTCGVSIVIYFAIKAVVYFVHVIIPIILNFISQIF